MIDKDLGLVFQPAESGAVDYPVAVPFKGRPVVTKLFGMLTSQGMRTSGGVPRQVRSFHGRFNDHRRILLNEIKPATGRVSTTKFSAPICLTFKSQWGIFRGIYYRSSCMPRPSWDEY